MTATAFHSRPNAPRAGSPGFVPASFKDSTVVDLVSRPVFEGPGKGWRLAFLVASLGTLAFGGTIVWLFIDGVGVWGVNSSVVWGAPIANYVWWIGIGNAGTLISSLLLLTRQPWRASINRFAEAMTIFAAAIAGMFPILHLGRPYISTGWRPIPTPWTLWPQWRSALVWDFWAILSYLLFSTHVLVQRPHSRPRDPARPGADADARSSSTACWRLAGAARRGTGTATTPSPRRWRRWRCRWWSRSTASSGSTSRRA